MLRQRLQGGSSSDRVRGGEILRLGKELFVECARGSAEPAGGDQPRCQDPCRPHFPARRPAPFPNRHRREQRGDTENKGEHRDVGAQCISGRYPGMMPRQAIAAMIILRARHPRRLAPRQAPIRQPGDRQQPLSPRTVPSQRSAKQPTRQQRPIRSRSEPDRPFESMPALGATTHLSSRGNVRHARCARLRRRLRLSRHLTSLRGNGHAHTGRRNASISWTTAPYGRPEPACSVCGFDRWLRAAIGVRRSVRRS
jgi:hypothetical protein